MNDEREGPAFSRSLKVVLGRRVGWGVIWGSVAVAKVREMLAIVRGAEAGGRARHRNLGTLEAMSEVVPI